MKSLDSDKKVGKSTNSTSEAAPEKEEVIDFSKVKVEPLFYDKHFWRVALQKTMDNEIVIFTEGDVNILIIL